ncbi:hypothetical protein [Bacillus arachidis]|uniref:hypothetical protein n=1 Tax=Bacillus arachidis TaxID=2819290 RepID=UPI00255CE9FE|nr:hypothetical protein [Bacillus arachidis]WIY62255.1 hypothetical protein QRY57_07045 [Bacillus arachidis]
MKFTKYFLLLFALILLVMTGCSIGIENEKQNIKVQQCIGNENNYEDFNEITNNGQVRKVRKIFDKANWENVKVDMTRPADYRFTFQFKNPAIEAKAVLYELWISPNKDKVEVVRGGREYVQLSKEDSASLFEILIGEKLGR